MDEKVQQSSGDLFEEINMIKASGLFSFEKLDPHHREKIKKHIMTKCVEALTSESSDDQMKKFLKKNEKNIQLLIRMREGTKMCKGFYKNLHFPLCSAVQQRRQMWIETNKMICELWNIFKKNHVGVHLTKGQAMFCYVTCVFCAINNSNNLQEFDKIDVYHFDKRYEWKRIVLNWKKHIHCQLFGFHRLPELTFASNKFMEKMTHVIKSMQEPFWDGEFKLKDFDPLRCLKSFGTLGNCTDLLINFLSNDHFKMESWFVSTQLTCRFLRFNSKRHRLLFQSQEFLNNVRIVQEQEPKMMPCFMYYRVLKYPKVMDNLIDHFILFDAQYDDVKINENGDPLIRSVNVQLCLPFTVFKGIFKEQMKLDRNMGFNISTILIKNEKFWSCLEPFNVEEHMTTRQGTQFCHFNKLLVPKAWLTIKNMTEMKMSS
jgi:hypothetical protein